jgi:hypothetical protein
MPMAGALILPDPNSGSESDRRAAGRQIAHSVGRVSEKSINLRYPFGKKPTSGNDGSWRKAAVGQSVDIR